MLNPTTAPLKIAIVGLGYVGLPLAVEFGKEFPVVGFDTLQQRVDELNAKYDRTHETSVEQLEAARQLKYSANPEDLHDCNVFIVTVPTPVDTANCPDLSMVINASQTVVPTYPGSTVDAISRRICPASACCGPNGNHEASTARMGSVKTHASRSSKGRWSRRKNMQNARAGQR